ncbi:hypothetical protein [Dokdonella ginsengisoli]|uniref:Uncharacterized protein n=1 Tax=Dokdonella ginsengisoli TaxID=363846 RepID=A0ABV9QV40_9GAMM
MNDEEVARVPSPDATLDVVLTQANPGATASFLYRVWLVPHAGDWRGGRAAVELYGATRNASAYGVDLRWTDADNVAVEYLRARSVASPPRVRVQVAGREVRLSLRAGIENRAAAPGGMPALQPGDDRSR